MKKLIRLAAVMMFIGIVLIGVAYMNDVRYNDIVNYSRDDEMYEKIVLTYAQEEVEKINCYFNNRSIKITNSDSDKVVLTFYKHTDETLTEENVDGNLTIANRKKSDWLSVIPKIHPHVYDTVRLEIPSTKKIQFLSFESTNGLYSLSDLNISEIALRGTNGSVKLKNVESDMVSIVTTNGSVSLSNVLANAVNVSSTNALVSLNDSNIKSFVCKTSNGAIILSNHIGDMVDLKSSNATIEIKMGLNIDHYNTNLSTSNGFISINGSKVSNHYINNDSQKDYYIKVNTSNGVIRLSW